MFKNNSIKLNNLDNVDGEKVNKFMTAPNNNN
jgi:hypothetical protein